MLLPSFPEVPSAQANEQWDSSRIWFLEKKLLTPYLLFLQQLGASS